jgi:hypothetical protein
MIGTLAFTEACARVIRYCPNEHAVAYARAGLRMTDREAIRVQVLYILGNMTGWRGEQAALVRTTLHLFK